MKHSFFKISNATLLAAGLFLAMPSIFGQVRTGSTLVGQNGAPNETDMPTKMMSNGPMAPQNNVAFIEQHVSDGIRENMAIEIALSQLALQHSQNPKIRSFAQRIITENRKIDLDAKRLTPEQSSTSPNPVFGGTRQAINASAAEKKLKVLRGQKFDEVYLVQMSNYLRSDVQIGHSAYAMMDIPNISPVGLNLWKLSRKRMDELAGIANKAHVHIVTD